MTDHATYDEWAQTSKLFEGLWPTAKDLTDDQLVEWQARLCRLKQPQVRGALRNVFAKTKYPKNPPALAAVLDEYYAIVRAQGNKQRDLRLRAQGVPAAEWAEIKREADDAREVLKALEPDDLERYKQTACKAMAFVRGYSNPPGDKGASNAHHQVATGLATQIVDDPDKWSPSFVLCVHGAMVLEYERQGVGAA